MSSALSFVSSPPHGTGWPRSDPHSSRLSPFSHSLPRSPLRLSPPLRCPDLVSVSAISTRARLAAPPCHHVTFAAMIYNAATDNKMTLPVSSISDSVTPGVLAQVQVNLHNHCTPTSFGMVCQSTSLPVLSPHSSAGFLLRKRSSCKILRTY